jgi:hypothetical protein
MPRIGEGTSRAKGDSPRRRPIGRGNAEASNRETEVYSKYADRVNRAEPRSGVSANLDKAVVGLSLRLHKDLSERCCRLFRYTSREGD